MAEIATGAPALPVSPPPAPPAAPAAPAAPPSNAPSAPPAPRDGFAPSLLRPGQRSQGDAFTPAPAQAPQPRPVARAEGPQRSAAESVPASRDQHVQQHYDRLRTAQEAQAGRPLNKAEQGQVRRQAEQVADRERATAANQVREEMLARARTSTSRIAGQTPEGMVRRAITENPNVTNEQILAMARLRPQQVASSPEAQRRTLQQIPNARSLPSHQFTVDMLHAVTGIDRDTLSRNGPDLGITGSADRVWPGTQTPIVFHAPPNDRERLSTSLHDLTDTMRYAGVPGVNNAVWGAENQVRSAAISLNGVPPRFLDQRTLNEGDTTVRPRPARR